MSRDVRVLAVYDGDRPIAFAQLEHAGDAAEITQVLSIRITAAAAAARR